MVQESHLNTCLKHYWSATFRLRWKKESISEHVKLEEKNRNFGFFTVFFFIEFMIKKLGLKKIKKTGESDLYFLPNLLWFLMMVDTNSQTQS